MRKNYIILFSMTFVVLSVIAAGCGGGAEDTGAEVTPAPTKPLEPWTFDLEWPQSVPLDESDTVRLVLIPAANGSAIVAEFANHMTVQENVAIRRPDDYILIAAATLRGTGFEIAPQGEQARELQPGERITWHWSITPTETGQQSMAVSVLMRWRYISEPEEEIHEFSMFSKGMHVQVGSILGMNRAQANQVGALLLLVVAGLAVVGGLTVWGNTRGRFPSVNGAPDVELQPQPHIELSHDEQAVLRNMFKTYGRVIIEQEFFSGYSGARTLMALPLRADGRRDARTIVKLGQGGSMAREWRNFEDYVKDSLPPLTGRIQQAPVLFRDSPIGGLRYTFIAQEDSRPQSLRQALLEGGGPELLERFFATFRQHWWLQHRPVTFRLGQEYDRKLPAHYTLIPMPGPARRLDGSRPPSELDFEPGDMVRLKNFPARGCSAGVDHISMVGRESRGSPAVRVNWLGKLERPPAVGKVVGTRAQFLHQAAAGFELFGMRDPLLRLDEHLAQTITSARSIIHGDLNLENILIGPGELLWLIDFAETREGHTLYDFAHLAAEVIGHIHSQQHIDPKTYLHQLRGPGFPLLQKMEEEAARCVPAGSDGRAYQLALYFSCIGAQKYRNLDHHAKHLLFLTAAHIDQQL